MKNYREIAFSEFKKATNNCRTLSASYRPLENEKTYEYESTVGEVLEHEIYPVYFVDSQQTKLVSYDDPDANPILFKDFVKRSDFMHKLLDNWFSESKGPITETSLVTLNCSKCKRTVVIDSIHRLSWLGFHKKYSAKVIVTELSGSQWPKETRDLNVVCL